MKKLILLELAFLFLATTFQSDNPPGWYQQTLPAEGIINDIFFLDSLNGWVVMNSGYILKTSNGGDNWDIQMDSAGNSFAVQFLDSNTGYVLGNDLHGIIYKTTNGGINWNLIHDFNPGTTFRAMSFVNKDTGFVCSNDPFDGGVFKTTDGGIDWQQQLNYGVDNPQKIIFINNDTGWISNNNNKLYKSINGGMNWDLIYISAYNIDAIFFLNNKKGWMRGGPITNTNGASYTTNGGFTWISSFGENSGFDVKFVNDSIGYAGGGNQPLRITKSTDGGKNWGYQNAQTSADISISVLNKDTSFAWAGRHLLIKTNKGGGTIVSVKNDDISLNKIFNLNQNYPNPFNPKTVISYVIQAMSNVKLKVFNIQGIEIKTLINQRQNSGEYNVEFSASDELSILNSGIYFYKLEVYDERTNETYSETKKMLLIK